MILQNNVTVFQTVSVFVVTNDRIRLHTMYMVRLTYDWVVLVTAGIITYQNDYPLTSQELYDYTLNKYGVEEMNDIHHYESVLRLEMILIG